MKLQYMSRHIANIFLFFGLLSVATGRAETTDSIPDLPLDSIIALITDTLPSDSIAEPLLLDNDMRQSLIELLSEDSIAKQEQGQSVSIFFPVVFNGQKSTPPLKLDFLSKPKPTFQEQWTLNPDIAWIEKADRESRLMARAENEAIIARPDRIRWTRENFPELPQVYIVKTPKANTLKVEEQPIDIVQTVGKENIRIKRWITQFHSVVQLSQIYLSPNWYQGGNSNFTIVSDQSFSLRYNHEVYNPKILFENFFQWRLNINSTPDDNLHKIKFSEDMFQINSKFGIKAYKNWYYSTSLLFKTMFFTNYESNSHVRTSQFMTPSEFNLGVGLTYQYSKGKFSTSMAISPLSYNLKFVAVSSHIDVTRFGIKEGKKSLNQVGSSFDGSMTWEFAPRMFWKSRLFFFTDYKKLQTDFENTLDLMINRYFSTRLFLHLRYDDSTAKDKDFGYLQIKELLSIGFNYTF